MAIRGGEKPKRKTAITIDQDLYDWVQERIETKEFSSFSHAVERGLYILKSQM